MRHAWPERIHILGASGSGTSTLGAALARQLGHIHLDTDEYFWEPTDPPFQQSREPSLRQALLGSTLDRHPRWVLSGSLCGWGDVFIPQFELVVLLLVPTEVRLARLRERERQRYGAEAIEPGGAMHEAHLTLLDWAAGYDEGGPEMRSRQLHEQWLAGLPCVSVRLTGSLTVAEQIDVLRTRLTL